MLIGHNNLPRKRCPQWRSLHHFLADNYLSSLLRLLASGFVAVELRTLMVFSPPAFVANVEKISAHQDLAASWSSGDDRKLEASRATRMKIFLSAKLLNRNSRVGLRSGRGRV